MTYQSDNRIFSFITAPWTLKQTTAMWNSAELVANIPRGKWHQLLSGLWAGEPLASFHFQRWLQHLSAGQKEAFEKVIKVLIGAGLWPRGIEAAPWIKFHKDNREIFATPLLELHQLREMLVFSKDANQEAEPQ